MDRINAASFVTCLESGSWTSMTEEEIGKDVRELSNLLSEVLNEKVGYGEKQNFLGNVRNRLKLLLVSLRVCRGDEKK